MGLLRVAAVGAVGYVAYRMWNRSGEHHSAPAFADGEAAGSSFTHVRNAGPQAMRDEPGQWDSVDQAVDESFPASDPPGTY